MERHRAVEPGGISGTGRQGGARDGGRFGHRCGNRPHGDGLNELRRVLGRAIDHNPARAIGQIVADLGSKRRSGLERLVGQRAHGHRR